MTPLESMIFEVMVGSTIVGLCFVLSAVVLAGPQPFPWPPKSPRPYDDEPTID